MRASSVGRAALLLGLALGLVFDQRLRLPWLGAGSLTFIALLLLAVGGVAALARRPPERRNAWLVGFVLWFAAVPMVRDASVLVLICTLGVVGLLLVGAELYA